MRNKKLKEGEKQISQKLYHKTSNENLRRAQIIETSGASVPRETSNINSGSSPLSVCKNLHLDETGRPSTETATPAAGDRMEVSFVSGHVFMPAVDVPAATRIRTRWHPTCLRTEHCLESNVELGGRCSQIELAAPKV